MSENSEDTVSLLDLYCMVRELEDTSSLASEVTSVASAFAEKLSGADQVKLASCGWRGRFERSITSTEVRALLPAESFDGSSTSAPLPRAATPPAPVPTVSFPTVSAPLVLPADYKQAAEFDVDNTFTGPGYVLHWAKENGLWPKKGSVACWNWFFNAFLGPDAAPKNGRRIIRKDYINDKLQVQKYPIKFTYRKADLTERFAKSKVNYL
jgi:hypothetical protein